MRDRVTASFNNFGYPVTIDPWKVASSKVLVKDKWISLRADKCLTSAGKVIDPYYVIDYPHWVTIFPITKDAELILVRQYRHGLGKILLELPCGAYDDGEVSSTTVAARELTEETGYTGVHFEEIATFSPNPANHSNLSHVVLATDLEHTQPQNLDLGEDIEVVLMPLKIAQQELREGTFVQAMHVAAMYYAFNYLENFD